MSVSEKIKWLAVVFIIEGLLVWGVLYMPSLADREIATVDSGQNTTRYNAPNRLIIPKLGIDYQVQVVDKTASGNMAVPSDYRYVGWYKLGPAPGQKGNAVIAGHLDTIWGKPAVFANLDQLAVGDDIFVIDNKGQKLHFEVVDIKSYDFNTKKVDEIFGPTEKTRLNLITCGGKWLFRAGSYSQRLVVFTELRSN